MTGTGWRGRVAREFDTEAELVEEYQSRLSVGQVALPFREELVVGAPCDVVLLHPLTGHMLSLRTTITWADPAAGALAAIDEFGAEAEEQVRAFVDVHAASRTLRRRVEAFDEAETNEKLEAEPPPPPAVEWGDETDRDRAFASDTASEEVWAEDTPTDDGAGPQPEYVAADEDETTHDVQAPDEDEADDEAEATGGDGVEGAWEGGDGQEGDDPLLLRTQIPAHVHERLRRLPTHEVYRLAKSGNFPERVALERIYGKIVWEPLLQNQNLTPPEVARIARMGTLPKPLIDVIVSHAGWLTQPLVRRALLTNPRLGGRALDKVLRALPKVELKAVPGQTAYPYRVREAAKRMLG